MIGILIITDAPAPSETSPSEATSSTDTGAVIGGTLLGVLALVLLVTAPLGCLIYYKRRKGRKLNKRYYNSTCTHSTSLWLAFLTNCNKEELGTRLRSAQLHQYALLCLPEIYQKYIRLYIPDSE